MVKDVSVLIIATFLAQSLPFNLTLVILLYWAVRGKAGTGFFVPAVLGGAFNDLINNLLVGSTLVGFGVVFLGFIFFRALFSQIGFKEGVPLILGSVILWQLLVVWVNNVL